MDECGSSVCGDSVQPHIFDEPDLTYHDLDLHPTPVEDPKGDEGPKDGPESKPVPTEEVLPGTANVKAPCVIMSVSTAKNSHIDLSMVCKRCGLVTVLQARSSDKDEFVNYHLTHESISGENGEKFITQMLLRCDTIINDKIDDYIRVLPSVSEMIKK